MTSPLRELAHSVGIYDDYWDQLGARWVTGPETDRALLHAMGLPADTDAVAAETLAALRAEEAERPVPRWLILEPDKPSSPALTRDIAQAIITLEDGTQQSIAVGNPLALPPLPLGIHVLSLDGYDTTLLVAPASLPLPAPGWGVTLPLYGLRTVEEGGLGDYADLDRAVAGLGDAGASFVGLNPVHAGFPTDPAATSPYSPSHRRRLNATHLALTEKRLNGGGVLIDYPAYGAEHRAALADEFENFEASGGDPAFDAWLSAGGASLERFATHQALSEVHGPYWCNWPDAFRDNASAEVAEFRAANACTVRFHAWAQWMAEKQLQAVADTAATRGMRHGLYLDLAVGTHPHGAETWSDGEIFAPGVSLGAPPDAFSPDGQVWALAPFNPRALAAAHFRPLAETLRRQMRFARLVRIDHVLGFERAFWKPTDIDAPGTYVVMPRDAMLAVVRIEAARAGATVIGEDLGNVPDGLQDAMTTSGILGCRLVMFEQESHSDFRRPDDYTEAALASFGSHDVPTWAGWRAASDVELRHDLGYLTDDDYRNGLEWRRNEVAGFDRLSGADGPDPDAMHRFLGSVRSRLVALQIEDILGIVPQANLPGTTDSHPNWRRRLPVAAAELGSHPDVARAAQIMRESGRQE